ncbi:MAG TPA: GspH/FimT family pseudopilin [Gemmatimonadales bacterium]|jgi:type IV fimbrial biogenesis protein FimT
MPKGVTLLEILLTLLLLGLLVTLAVPGFSALHDRLAVQAATDAVTSAHARARLLAVAEGRVAVLTITSDSVVVRVIEAPADTVRRWRGDGPAAHGVTAGGTPRTVLFAPSGITMGVANATYTLTRGAARKQVVVSRYGRVRVL